MAASMLKMWSRLSADICPKRLPLSMPWCIARATYAKKLVGTKALAAKAMAAQITQRKRLEVETDPHKLVNYLCGGNIYREGEDPELKPDSEYPDWLWTLRTERGSVPIEELEYDTEEYWRKVRKESRKQRNLMMKTKYKFKEFKDMK